MFKFLLKWFVSAIAVLVVVHVFSGVSSANLLTTIIMALVLGLLNTFVKPILSLLSLPFVVMTMGLFMLVINGLTFFIAAKLVHGFYVAGFGSALWAALLYSVVTFLINLLIKPEDDINYVAVYKSRRLR
jgi:putative membrane protein